MSPVMQKTPKKQTQHDALRSAKGPQISPIIVVENLELAPLQTQLALLEVSLCNK